MKRAKPATPIDSESVSDAATAIRVLKTGTCPSLSGKSKLTYQIGCSGKSEIHFRVSANSGGGFFSDEWVSLGDIQEALDKAPSGKPITSFSLSPLFRGKSMNSPGFLFAALMQEGIVQPSKTKKRCYERGDLKGFMTSVKALTELTADTKAKPRAVEDKPKQLTPSKAAAPAKKTAASPKKAPAKPGAKKKA